MSISYGKSSTKLTYDEYVLFPDDGRRHEIVNGRHYMTAAPSPRHQAVSRYIQFQLFEQIELKGRGQVINSPIDLQLSTIDVVQPDIVVVLKENRIITTTKIKGVPNLVVEVLSPATRAYDRQLKKQLYEQASVPEYWIVDPEEQKTDKLQLDENGLYRVSSHTDKIPFDAAEASVDLCKVWR